MSWSVLYVPIAYFVFPLHQIITVVCKMWCFYLQVYDMFIVLILDYTIIIILTIEMLLTADFLQSDIYVCSIFTAVHICFVCTFTECTCRAQIRNTQLYCIFQTSRYAWQAKFRQQFLRYYTSFRPQFWHSEISGNIHLLSPYSPMGETFVKDFSRPQTLYIGCLLLVFLE